MTMSILKDGEGHTVRVEARLGCVPRRRAYLPRDEWATVGLSQLLAAHRTHLGSGTGGDGTARCQAYFCLSQLLNSRYSFCGSFLF